MSHNIKVSNSEVVVKRKNLISIYWDKKKQEIKYTLEEMKRKKMLYFFLAPYAAIFILFTVIPVVVSIGLSFTYYNVLEPPKFVGWSNYIRLFLNDDVFLIAVKNTLLFAAITGPIGYFASLIFAWLINELSPKIRAFVILVFYAPSISGQAYMIWTVMFSGDTYGYINGNLMKLGLLREPILWLEDPKYMLGVIMLIAIWMSMGAGFLAFIAGLQGIDKSLYEAGYVDGIKNRWQELWFITLPSMKPQLMFGAVMSISSSFAAAEITTSLAGFPSVDYAAHTVVNHLADYGGIRFEMGYASTIATVLFVFMIGTNKLVQHLLKKVGR
jgi:multiple sugar transport system permease protein